MDQGSRAKRSGRNAPPRTDMVQVQGGPRMRAKNAGQPSVDPGWFVCSSLIGAATPRFWRISPPSSSSRGNNARDVHSTFQGELQERERVVILSQQLALGNLLTDTRGKVETSCFYTLGLMRGSGRIGSSWSVVRILDPGVKAQK